MRFFLLAIGPRQRASSRLRVWDHLEWLRGRGHRVTADALVPAGVTSMNFALLIHLGTRYPRWVLSFFASDVIVLQEVLALWPILLFKNWGRRRRVLFDFSDPVDRIGTGLRNAIRRRLFRFVVSRADFVLTENPAYHRLLGKAAGQIGNFYGPVDARRYAVARDQLCLANDRPRPFRIGWTGSPGTFRFIAPLLPIIDEIARSQPIEVVLIGAPPAPLGFRHAQLTTIEWSEDIEFATLPSFDLGLFRLEDDEAALWRGAGKLFMYIAAGVPFIATDRGIAQLVMAEFGLGYAVASDAEWAEALVRAIADGAGRATMTERGGDIAIAKLSYDAYRTTLAHKTEISAA